MIKRLLRNSLPPKTLEIVRDFVWRQLNLSWQLPSGLEVKIANIAEWVIYNDIFVNGEYDSAIELVIADSDSNPLIVDVGVNVGYFGLCFADKWFRKKRTDKFTMIGIEGSPKTYAELEERMKQSLLTDYCDYHLGLVGKREGKAYISSSAFHVANAVTTENSSSTSEVSYLDLDSILPTDKRVALLKCDIEGSEELFFENYPDLLKRTDIVVLESHPTLCDVTRCFEFLSAAGLAHFVNIRSCDAFTVDIFKRTSKA